jgi:phage repressor protein C with HTH and peptisase S24 domain
MLTHAQIWGAIDALAERCMLSPSGLARKAGLDSTTFNRSKRIATDGRLRWPSTESIAKALDATSQTLETFTELLMESAQLHGASAEHFHSALPLATLPLVSCAALAQMTSLSHYFNDQGAPITQHVTDEHNALWEAMPAPLAQTMYAPSSLWGLEIVGSDYTPIFREGDRLIVSAHATTRRDDRVVLIMQDAQKNHQILIGTVLRDTAHRITLQKLDRYLSEHIVDKSHVLMIARIMWASQ